MILKSGYRAGKCVIITVYTIIVRIRCLYRHNSLTLHFLSESFSDIRIIRNHFRNNIRSAGKRILQGFHAFFRINIILRKFFRIFTGLLEEFQCQGLQALLLGDGGTGAAFGTVGTVNVVYLCYCLGSIYCRRKLMKMRAIFDLNKQTVRLDKNVAMRIIRLGVPSGITQAIFSVAMLVVQSLTNSLGEMVIAANVIIMRVDGFAMMPNMTFGQAMSVYTGQNVGAGKFDRVTKGTRQGLLIAVGASTVLTVAILIFGKTLFGFFTDTPELIDLATRMIRLMAVGYICIAITQVLGGVMRGAGDTVSPMWISIISTIIVRIPVAYLVAYLTRSAAFPNGHPFALSASLLVSWTAGMLISIIAYRRSNVRQVILGKTCEELGVDTPPKLL